MQLSLSRILLSAAVMVALGAGAFASTGAFFSDTETSTGNTFAAGDIDLKIDNTSYVTNADGVLVASPNNTWALSDLTDQLFFSFSDVKPGDIGEDTISVHAGSNNAWACMAANITATPENTLVDPEVDAGDAGPADGNNGELQNYLNFTFWNDDGDNVYETGEGVISELTGTASTTFDGTWLPLADSSMGTSSAIIGGTTHYIGKAWCFGTLAANGTAQDGSASSTPLTRGTTGFTCDGSGSNNVAQTDGIVVDVSFQAVQTRNNAQFLCSELPPLGGTPPPPTATTTLTVTKTVVNDNGGNLGVGDFPLFIDGIPVTSGVAMVVTAGAHLVSETGQNGYAGLIAGDCASNGQINVATSTNPVCTITNNDIAPTITLTKVIVGGPVSDPATFALTIDGSPVSSGSSTQVSAGGVGHAIAEASIAGYTGVITGSAQCPTTVGSSTAPLSLAQNISCTITNTFNAPN